MICIETEKVTRWEFKVYLWEDSLLSEKLLCDLFLSVVHLFGRQIAMSTYNDNNSGRFLPNILFLLLHRKKRVLFSTLPKTLIIAAGQIWVVQLFSDFSLNFPKRVSAFSALVLQCREEEEWLPVHNSCNIQYIESRGFSTSMGEIE